MNQLKFQGTIWTTLYFNTCISGKFPVPDIMFTTIEPPVNQLSIVGRGCLLQAKVLRTKKDLKGESNAKEISDSLPFIEYELHRQLFNKLKVKGMNAIFGLKMSFSLSDRLMVATATATGKYIFEFIFEIFRIMRYLAICKV